jgi:L-malate glycosyltransferase
VTAEPLRLGIVCHASFGGSGVIATELGLCLAARGHQVHFFCAGAPPRLALAPGLTLHTVASPTHPLFPQGEFALALASALAEGCARERLQVLHVHYGIPFAVSAYLARALLGERAPRLVTTLHGTDVSTFGLEPALAPVLRLAVASSEAVTVPSLHQQALARHHLGLSRVEVVGDFVDTDRFAPPATRDLAALAALFPSEPGWGAGEDRPWVLLHNSNLRALKRVGDAVEVLARVRARHPAVLVLVGDGPERDLARDRAQALGVSAAVALVGERVDVVPLLQLGDVFLLPSETESFGLAALEALSCGVPVVASRTGGLPELVRHGENGFLHPVGDVDAMAASVGRLLAEPATRRAFSLEARRSAEASWRRDPLVDRYLACYRRVLGPERLEERTP